MTQSIVKKPHENRNQLYQLAIGYYNNLLSDRIDVWFFCYESNTSRPVVRRLYCRSRRGHLLALFFFISP